MLKFLILCLGYGKLILQGTQKNECKNYITEIVENSKIIVNSDNQNIQIYIETEDPCQQKVSSCKQVICDINQNQILGIYCLGSCDFQVYQIENSDLIGMDKEVYQIIDTDVIYLDFSQQSELINYKYLVFESELVNPQQNWDNLNYNLSVQYSDQIIYAINARMGAQLIEIVVDNILLNANYILIKIEGQKGSSFKIYTHAYNDNRKIKLFKTIDGTIDAQTIKIYQLDYNSISDLHKNKDLLIKINIYQGIVDFCINIADIPQRISDSQWIVNTNQVSEIIIHKEDIQQANYIYIMIQAIVNAIYTLKLNIEGEIQYIDSGEIIMGKLYPDTILQGFQFHKNEQNLFKSVVIEKKGDFDLAVLDCELYISCNIEKYFYNQENSNQTQKYKYQLIHNETETIYIQHQYLSFGIIATKQEIVNFQLKIIGKDAIVYLIENVEFQHSSTTSSSTTYQYQIQKQDDLLIDKIYIHLIRHYGLIELNGQYNENYSNQIAQFQQQITIDNVVNKQMIIFNVNCHHSCDYSVNLQINRNYKNSLENQKIVLDKSKNLKFKIEDELFFELPDEKQGYNILLINCTDQLQIQLINSQNQIQFEHVCNISSLNQPIILTSNVRYLRISTQIPQIIQLTLISNQMQNIKMNGEVYSQIDQYEILQYTYQLHPSSNATILVKSLNNQIALNIKIWNQKNQLLYEDEGIQNIIHIPASNDQYINIQIKSIYSTALYLKIQENSEFYKYQGHPLKLFIDQDQIKIYTQSSQQYQYTYSVMFDKPVPFKIYINWREYGVNEFPNKTNYDYMSYHSDSIFQHKHLYEAKCQQCQQLILIQFGHVVNQVLIFQMSRISKIQPNSETFLTIHQQEIIYFEIDTYTNIPQIIFMFGQHQNAFFLLEKGCNKTIQKQDFNNGFDLLRETNIEFSNITMGCYIGGIYNPYDSPITINFQWIQQLYLIHDYINNTVMTKQASELTTFFYIDFFDNGKITFYPYEGYLKIIQVPIQIQNELRQQISLLEINDTKIDYKICNISCTISNNIGKQQNQFQGLLIKIMFQQTKTYTIFMEDLVYNKQLQFDGIVLFQKLLKDGQTDLFQLIQQQSKIMLYIRTITGQLQLSITNENSQQSIQINNEMYQIELEQNNYTIQLNQIGQNNTIYEIQTQLENIKLKFGQLYFGNKQKTIFTLPLVDYEQNITYGVSILHQQLYDCQISINIWNRFNSIYNYSTNQSAIIESLHLDLNQYNMEINFQCDPPQYESYYVYIQPSYTHLSMVMMNKGILFNTESMSNDVYFVNIEQLGFVVIEITQLKGQIISYATRNINMIYNGISELSVQTIDNYHYKLILEVDSLGILYFGIKCISIIKCEYIINVKSINDIEFNLNDIKLGKAEYNQQSKNLTINSSIQFSNKLKTVRYAIYYDTIKPLADKYITDEDYSIILDDFKGQQLFVEMEFIIKDTDYFSKLMYDPIIILQEHTIIVQQSYISYILLIILLILGLGLLLYIVQLKKKLKYEMSDARNLVHSNNEIELNSK